MWRNILITLLCLAIIAVSFFPLADHFTNPEIYRKTVAAIDEKSETILKLTATATAASAVITAIPDDTATPVAQKLSDFTEYFLLILCVLYAEKYLLSVIAFAAFRILIPIACVLWIISLYWNPGEMRRLAVKTVIFALVISIAVPISILVSDMVYDSYSASVQETVAAGTELSAQPDADTDHVGTGFWSIVSGATSDLLHRATEITNRYLESLAVMIVTSCVIPSVVMLFFFWIIRLLTELQLTIPTREPGEGCSAG